MAAVESASAEERDRLRATYKQRLQDMEARLKVGTKFNVRMQCGADCCGVCCWSRSSCSTLRLRIAGSLGQQSPYR